MVRRAFRGATIRLCVAAAVTASTAPHVLAQAARSITGVVQDSTSGEKIAFATTYIAGTRFATMTNADGRFALLGAPTDSFTLRVRFVGYSPRLVHVPRGATAVPLVVLLAPASMRLAQVVVSVEADRALDLSAGPSTISMSTQQIQSMPSLGEADVFRALQMLPGVSAANDGSSGLYVRGGTPDQNLVLLDGMTVYHVDHFFGIFSAFNADAIKGVQLYEGGFPAKYGGRVSSVVDLTGKSGDEKHFRASGGLGLMDGRGVLEIPLGKGSILLSARRSYTDIIQTPLYNRLFGITKTASGVTTQSAGRGGPGFGGPGGFRGPQNTVNPSFYFYDFNGKLSYRPTDRDMVSLSLYSGADWLDQSSTNLLGGPGGGSNDGSSQSVSIGDVTNWGNRGASARWFRQWTDRLSSNAVLSSTRYFSKGDRSNGAQGATVGGRAVNSATREDNTVDDQTLRADNELRLTAALAVDFGVWLTRNDVAYSSLRTINDTGSSGLERRTNGTLNALYTQARWHPMSVLDVTVGLRQTTYSVTQRSDLEPRASFALSLTPALTIHGAWGIHHQYVNRVENEDVLRGSRDFWILADSAVPPTESEHRTLGFVLSRSGWEYSLEAYDKQLTDVSLYSRRLRPTLSPGSGAAEGAESLFHTGTGSARGLEFMAQRIRGAITGWVSYRLGRADYAFPAVNGGAAYPANHDRTHEAKAVANYATGAWKFAATWVFGTGTPYSAQESQYYLTLLDGTSESYIHIGDKNRYRLPAYHRLDLAAFRTFTGSDHFDWDLGVSVFNAYAHKNVWYRQFDLSTTPMTVNNVMNLGFTPSIDLRFRLK
ncbi:MAG: TonB-dependent receptor [Gemmatimonadaceae bacterium]|jgi:hypothetical protein